MCEVKCLYSAIICLIVCTSARGQDAMVTAGEKFENVTVLQNMPADHMGKVMNIMSAALGVNCTHCHLGFDFANEGAENKASARKMIAMTLGINKEHFGGRTVVTCMTCHQGNAKPVNAMVSATHLAATSASETTVLDPIKILNASDIAVRKQSVSAVLERALPGRQANSDRPFVEQKWKAIRKEPSGKQEEELITISDRTSWEQVTHYGPLTVNERFKDGVVEKWAGDNKIELKPDEKTHIKIEAILALGMQLESLFSHWTLADPVTIANRPMQVLQAKDGEQSHHFYFDDETGLLRRRTASLPTVLGAFVVEVDYEDYHSVNSVQKPFRTIVKMPSVTWEQQIQR